LHLYISFPLFSVPLTHLDEGASGLSEKVVKLLSGKQESGRKKFQKPLTARHAWFNTTSVLPSLPPRLFLFFLIPPKSFFQSLSLIQGPSSVSHQIIIALATASRSTTSTPLVSQHPNLASFGISPWALQQTQANEQPTHSPTDARHGSQRKQVSTSGERCSPRLQSVAKVAVVLLALLCSYACKGKTTNPLLMAVSKNLIASHWSSQHSL